MNKKIATLMVILLLGIVISAVWMITSPYNDQLTQLDSQTNNSLLPRESDESIGETSSVTYKTFQNKEVGISFTYPDIFERVEAEVFKGETGKKFSGVLEIDPRHVIIFGGVTPDYTASRGGSIGDTFGSIKNGDHYEVRFPWGDIQVVPTEILNIPSTGTEAIVVSGTEIGQVLSSDSYAVFVNIPDSDFKGVAFVSSVNSKESTILKGIVSSIVFE